MFAPLLNFTHYSIQYGFSKPKKLVAKCVENGYKACGIADRESLSGSVEFFQECKKANIKPIIGCSFSGFTLFIKNKVGWYNLINALSTNSFNESNCKPENLICVVDQQSLIHPEVIKHFGDNILINDGSLKEYFYTTTKDVDVHRISIASGMKFSLKEAEYAPETSRFFKTKDYAVPDKDIAQGSDLIKFIVDSCEDYTILSNPILPVFPTPNGESEEEYLRYLCSVGWDSKLEKKNKLEKSEKRLQYEEQYEREFAVFKKATLFGYFLIVADILDFLKKNDWLAGPGRGSAAGCLISYLINITKIDPIVYELLFERFYNESRNTEGNISLPDVDIDVPSDKRDETIQYLKDKYGKENVSQMITLMRYMGRSALKEVLTMNKACGFAEMNAISEHIPDEAAISDELEKMDDNERSIIRWALLNNTEELRPFCHIDTDGSLKGDYALYFEQAIKLEGTFKSMGKHPAGVVISVSKLADVCPMTQEGLAAFEMSALEATGQCKIDVLGVAFLSKLMYAQGLSRKRKKKYESKEETVNRLVKV